LTVGTAERERKAATRLTERVIDGATFAPKQICDASAFVKGLTAYAIESWRHGTVSKTGQLR
jgi:hypothetical protein